MKRLGALVVGLVATAGLMAFLVLMGSLIYPGALEWTAGSVCPDDKPDTIVVRDTYQTEPGETSTNFTLYCLGPRGETENAGFGKPVGILILWAVALATAMILVRFVIGAVRRLISGRGDDGPIGGPDEMAPGSVGTVAPPTTDYGGQPPLIT